MRALIVASTVLMVAVGCRAGVNPDPNSASPGSTVLASMGGHVVDQATNRGLSGAMISLMPNPEKYSSAEGASGITTDGGVFLIDRIVGGEYIVEVNARGYRLERHTLRLSPGQNRTRLVYRLSTEAKCPPNMPKVPGVVCR
jgi:hypothetical protein